MNIAKLFKLEAEFLIFPFMHQRNRFRTAKTIWLQHETSHLGFALNFLPSIFVTKLERLQAIDVLEKLTRKDSSNTRNLGGYKC